MILPLGDFRPGAYLDLETEVEVPVSIDVFMGKRGGPQYRLGIRRERQNGEAF